MGRGRTRWVRLALVLALATALAGAATPVTATIGLASAPLDGSDLASLLEAADRRLYEGKGMGGDRVVGRADDEAGANVTRFPAASRAGPSRR